MHCINSGEEWQRQREQEMKKSLQLLALAIPYAKSRQVRFIRNAKNNK